MEYIYYGFYVGIYRYSIHGASGINCTNKKIKTCTMMTRQNVWKTMKKSANLTKHLYHFQSLMFFLLLRLFISLFFLWHRIILERKFSKFAVFIPLRCSFGTTSNCPPFQRRLAKRLFVGWGFTIPYARCMEYVPTNLPQIYGIHVWWTYQSYMSIWAWFQGIFTLISSFRWSNLTCAYYGLKMLKLETNNYRKSPPKITPVRLPNTWWEGMTGPQKT